MLVSRLVKESLELDSQSFKDLSPKMKEAVSDVFKIFEKESGTVIEKFENAINKVADHYNISLKELNSYFDKEVIEQLGEK
tara:strand:- start:994 stop:1236 length:243 start_codon:yes stop_codon:yes gene_type:complete